MAKRRKGNHNKTGLRVLNAVLANPDATHDTIALQAGVPNSTARFWLTHYTRERVIVPTYCFDPSKMELLQVIAMVETEQLQETMRYLHEDLRVVEAWRVLGKRSTIMFRLLAKDHKEAKGFVDQLRTFRYARQVVVLGSADLLFGWRGYPYPDDTDGDGE